MKKWLLGLLLVLNLGCQTARENSVEEAVQSQNLIIFFDKEIGQQPLLEAVAEYPAEILYQYRNLNGMAIRVAPEKNVDAAIRHFEKVKGVLGVEKDRVMQLH